MAAGSAMADAKVSAGTEAQQKNYTGVVTDIKSKKGKAAIAVTSGTDQTVETTVSGMQVTKSGVIQQGDRASITGTAKGNGDIAAERVIVSGGAVVAKDAAQQVKSAGATAGQVVDKRGGSMAGAKASVSAETNAEVSADADTSIMGSVLGAGKSVAGGIATGTKKAANATADVVTTAAGATMEAGKSAINAVTGGAKKLTAIPTKQNYSGVIKS